MHRTTIAGTYAYPGEHMVESYYAPSLQLLYDESTRMSWESRCAYLTFVNIISACPCGASSAPNTVIGRFICTPVALIGTRIMLCCLWGGAVESVLPMKMETAHLLSHAPEIQILWPFIT